MSHEPPHPPYTPPPPPYGPTPYGPTPYSYPWQPVAPEPPRPVHHPHREPLGRRDDLRMLRDACRRQRGTATLTTLGCFTLFLLLSAYAPGALSRTVAGGVPAGLLLALLQVPVTWLATARYERTARRRVDPLADRVRRRAELDARRGVPR
ncbi:DUF485 domain-containing protein [Streptomyces sp. LP11]|uniref:DUF485 domain-containing protein n=1 Tax=Streptomyces pyxinicus TaxID=2970331 RepID=A0ABT2AVE4_9ACTN|nr:DUF485 domain-containing protein [Streptomyces sp. LP11]MCS0600224.1 DUF485 domain-containing protein [Streptomyces sp. LP11]